MLAIIIMAICFNEFVDDFTLKYLHLLCVCVCVVGTKGVPSRVLVPESL